MNSLNKIFKIIGLSLLVWSLCSCTEEKISRHQTVLDEELTSQRTDALSESEQTQDFAQFSEDHLAIQAKINSNDNEQWIQALDELKVKLFGPGTGNQSVYGSRQYAGYLALYRSLYGKWSNNSYDHSESFKTQFQESLNQFKTTFVDSCTDSNVQDCDYLRHSLRRVGSVVDIIEYFARNENDDLKKLALIGVAFEVGNQRAKQNLTELYIDTYFKLSESGTSIPTPVRHSDNIVTALRLLDWENPNPDTIRYMKIIKPWVNDSTGLNQAVETMRPFLSPFIAIYALVDEEINNQFTTHTSEYWRNFVSEKKSLNTYPAYDNINIQQLFDLPAWEYHLLFAVYFNEMSITEANNLIRNFPNKEESLSRMITAAKIIVRWDLALLSIDTMAKVGTYYSNEPIKSAHHVNDSKAYANTFRNEWVGFHNGRVEALQGLLESQTVSLSQEQILDLSEFFSSIDRNIMKTVIYPAMMIFIYEMIRSDYQETLFGVFQIDTDLDIELFFSGSFRGLWFDYLKAEDGLGRGELSRKISLFRHEIIDAMYYVFATRAHESFGVEMDDFISVLMKDLLIERELLMTIIQEEQRQIYGREDSRSRQWITWCEGLKSGQSQPEVLRYYELDRYLMQHSKAFFGDIMEFNKDSLDTGLFYSDEYHSDNFDYIYRETLSYVYGVTAFSRIRQEAMPIMDNYKIVIESMERLKTQYPQIFSSDLQASKEYYSKFDNRMRSFLGQHIHYGEMVDDCLYQSVKESRRRSQEIIKSEYDYISKIVYPIMKEVSEGRLTVEDGNNLLYKVNGNTDHYDSKIVQGNQTEQVFYKYSKSSYMNRTRQYLTRGLTFDEEGFETVSIEPVVGSSMSISVPADALISPDNPFRGAHYREVYYSSDMSPDQLAREVIARSSDQMSFTPRRDLFTSWDLFETSFFQHQPLTRESHEKNRLDHLAQRFLINGFKVADYNNPACTDLSAQLPESCFINKDIPLEKLTEAMNDSFKMIEIDEDKGYYLDLIKEDHYLHRDHLGIQLRFDGHIGFEQSKIWSITSPHERPIPFTQVKGMFDLIFEMFKSPYLGRQFKNDYYLSLNSRYQGRSPGRTYAVMGPFTERDGDEWLHAYHRAEEFYLARTQRGPFMFKFDEEILTSQFEEVQDDLMKHYNAIDELMEKKDSEFAKYRTDGIPSNYKIRQNREGYELHPLSPGMTQLQREMDTFQTKTEDLYKNEDPSWSKFLPYQ